MRKSVVGGILGLSLLSFFTFIVTSRFITPLVLRAQQPRARSGAANVSVPRVRLDLTNQDIPLPSGSPRIPEFAKSQVTRSVRMLVAETDGNLVHLQASATLVDPRPGIKYVWWVRLFEGNEKKQLFFDKLYTHQTFAVPPEGMKPTFEDILALPVDPGHYVVDVGLITFSPDRDLATERDKKLRNGDLACGSAKITVGD